MMERMPPPRFDVVYRGEGLMVGVYDTVSVAVWNSRPTLPLFEIQSRELRAVVARHPGSALFLCIVAEKAEPPSQDIRDASAKMVTGHGKNLAACACVIEGEGFRSAITRTVLSGIAFVVRTPGPSAFFETTSAACEWLAARARRS